MDRPSSRDRILVTGATGNVGRQVVKELRSRSVPLRIATRGTAARAEAADESICLDFHDTSSFDAALDGCGGLFLLRPPAVGNTKATLNPLVERARALGVEHVVFVSVMGAADRSYVPHHAVERCLREGPADWTILRPGFFAQNLESAYRDDVVQHDRIHVPAGRGRVAFVDLRDVGELAARVFVDPTPHIGETYDLTGSRAFTFDEVAELLTQAVGRTVRYEPASVLGYLRHLRRSGLGVAHSVIQTVLHVGLRGGAAETVDPTLGGLLGRRARDVGDYVRDHADLWTA